MGGQLFLGFVVTADADPAIASVHAFQGEVQGVTNAVQSMTGQGADAFKGLRGNIEKTHESGRLLEATLGVRLPRAMTGALAEMAPALVNFRDLFIAAFVVERIPQAINAIAAAASALGGYTDAVREAEKADVDASNAALIHFTTIAAGTRLIAETNRELAAMSAKQGNWKDEMKAASSAVSDSKAALLSILGPIGDGINLYRGYEAAVKETGDAETAAANLRERLIEQLDRQNDLFGDINKKRIADAKQAAREAKKADDEYIKDALADFNRYDQTMVEQYYTNFNKTMAAAGKQIAADQEAAEKAAQHAAQQQKEDLAQSIIVVDALSNAMQREAASARSVGDALNVQENATRHLSVAEHAHYAIVQDITIAQDGSNRSTAQSIAYVSENVAGILQTLGAKREAAAMMAIYEAAEGFQDLSDYDFFAAAQAFASSAMYAKAAGSSGGSGSGGGGGGGGGGGSSGGGGGGSQSSYGRGGSGGASGSGGSATPGGGITVHNHIQGVISPDVLPQVMEQINQLVKGGQGYLTASNALYNGEKLG